VNTKEIADQIEKKAGVVAFDSPIAIRFMTRAPDGAMVMIEINKPWPIRADGSVVFSMFQGYDEVRVYTLAPEPPAGQALIPPARYTISKHQPAVFHEMMTLDTFMNEIANELVMVAEDVSSAEKERAAVVQFMREKNSQLYNSLAEEIEAGDHLEDDEDVEPAPVVPSVSTSPS
jgi:hypothetical protein